MNKKNIRENVAQKISLLSKEQKHKESEWVCQKIIRFLEWETYDTLITYDAFLDEVTVEKVSLWCSDNHIKVIIMPQSIEDILLPTRWVILVPWRAFTKWGKRIGRWSGFYDRLLAKSPGLKSIGICYSCQIFRDLPEDTWDKRVDMVVFGENIIK